jgi:hypothetical protein
MSRSPASEFDACNHTELLQLCVRAGLQVPPATPKEMLIAYLTGEEAPPAEKNNVDTWRHGIMGFLLDHWAAVRPQLSCPAKSGDPRSCFNCEDPQVISCLVDNPDDEHLIHLKRKPS